MLFPFQINEMLYGKLILSNRERTSMLDTKSVVKFLLTTAFAGILGLVASLALPTNSHAQSPVTRAAEKPAMPWSAEDIINAESAGGFRISPDGKWAVWS